VYDPLQITQKIAASGLEAQSRRMRVVAENMANAESTGATPGSDPYTRKTVDFQAEVDDALGATMVKVEHVDQDTTPFRIEHNPGHPAADENGFVKLPNVNLLVEMADMREANRSYEANLQVMKQARAMIMMTLDLLRSS
jgi:flagellar basal-body rod protein FlgC